MLHQVNYMFQVRQFVLKQFIRSKHNGKSSKIIYPLTSRKVLNVRGPDSAIYLQGLVTNDMRHFEEGAKSMYAMFLNTKGRVLYDVLIHKWDADDSFLIECDKAILSQIHKHLKIYKLKRRIEILDLSNEFQIHALVQNGEEEIQNKHSISCYKDPRLPDLGYRIISPTSTQQSLMLGVTTKDAKLESSDEGYKRLRYQLGVSEGSEDLPPGTSFPLEVNCDYLHGVSFHKGCYIGQELTARVHHTGVIRKRIMPIKFKESVDNLEKDTVVFDSDNVKSNVGKLKGFIEIYGLGLLRIKEALDAKSLKVGEYSAVAIKPEWWPIEAPKEKINVLKAE